MENSKDIRRGWANMSYSQEGEDILLSSMLVDVRQGFYVDVGAHHPKRFSNTYLFYRRGWSGINIDPTPNCMALFSKMRPRDLNLEIGIAREDVELQLFMFEEGALNTFDPSLAQERQERGWRFLGTRSVRTRPLGAVLHEHCRAPIQLLNIDAEGLDLEVLQSNDWSAYRPALVCVEALQRDDDPTGPLLVAKGCCQRLSSPGDDRTLACIRIGIKR